ncbi:hypothetical protein VULLAG_LOCUS20981 [Vulpes lagopus]
MYQAYMRIGTSFMPAQDPTGTSRSIKVATISQHQHLMVSLSRRVHHKRAVFHHTLLELYRQRAALL